MTEAAPHRVPCAWSSGAGLCWKSLRNGAESRPSVRPKISPNVELECVRPRSKALIPRLVIVSAQRGPRGPNLSSAEFESAKRGT
jgi:hypothetical protein